MPCCSGFYRVFDKGAEGKLRIYVELFNYFGFGIQFLFWQYVIMEKVLKFVRRRQFAIILIANLMVFAVYFIPNYESKIEQHHIGKNLYIAMMSIYHSLICIGISVVLTIFKKWRTVVKSLLLSALIVLIIGISSCFG
ncbi:MAG: hypothetical protein WBG46_05280 [Nonlabens sp.]